MEDVTEERRDGAAGVVGCWVPEREGEPRRRGVDGVGEVGYCRGFELLGRGCR